jgi:hypothetical protein
MFQKEEASNWLFSDNQNRNTTEHWERGSETTEEDRNGMRVRQKAKASKEKERRARIAQSDR